jgi:hypothetical protein
VNRDFAESLSGEGPDPRSILYHRRRASVWSASLARLNQIGFYPVSENVALKLGEDRKHPCQGPATTQARRPLQRRRLGADR